MAYKILEANGVDNENVDGGALNRFIARNKSGIIGGVLSECALTATGSQVGVSPGLLMLCGIRVKITEIETLGFSALPVEPIEYQIIAQVTLGGNGVVDFSLFSQLPATLIQEELYISGRGAYQVELGRFTHATDGSITNLKQTLPIIGEADGGSSITEWDSTVTYKDGDIVYRDGNIYLCIADEADGDSPETLLGDSWELISKGEKPRGELSIIATFNITEANTVITLQNLVGMTYIDWGDGTTDSNLTHTYTTIGEYTCKIYGCTEIGRYAFHAIGTLTDINIISDVTSIGEFAFHKCNALENVYIGDCVTAIDNYAFYACGLKRLNIDNSVTVIGRGAFNTCINLISVILPNSVNSISWGAFANCTSLVSVTIGDGVTNIGESAFQNCPKLLIIEIKAIVPPTVGINAFLYNYAFEKIIVPAESLEAYKTAEGCSDYVTLICSYVTSLDYAGYDKKMGVVGINNTADGIQVSNGVLSIIKATDSDIDERKTNRPITPENLDYAVKIGVTTNTETLTDEEKASACDWVGALPQNFAPTANPSNMRNVFTSIYNRAGEFINSTIMVDCQNTASREQIPVRGKHSTNIYLPDDPIYETDSVNKKYVDNKFDIIDSILSQSGISYQADIVDTYTERITADGENVLDGSKAVLKKVVGNTVACKNLFDKNTAIDGYEIINANDGTLGVSAEWFTTDYIPVRPNTDYVVSGKPNGSAVMAYNSNKEVVRSLSGGANEKFATTEDTAFVRLNGLLTEKDTFQLEQGTIATEYQPYFTGLKSASFGGIESKNADGTEMSTLSFPKTETPLGTTIDFENKKIIETYVEYVFKGDETVYSNGAYGDEGYYRYTILNAVDMATGSAQNGICDRYPTDKTDWGSAISECVRFGQGQLSTIYLILKREATVEEIKVLIKGMTIRYPLATPTETDFTAEQSASGNEYTAYKGGTETVLENDGNEYGADNTLTQNYLFVKEVK